MHNIRDLKDPWSLLSADEKAGLAAQLQVSTTARLNTLATVNDTHPFLHWQPGVLHPYGLLPDDPERAYWAGLTQEGTLLILVPTSLVEQRRRAWLEYLANLALGTTDREAICCYCDLAEREILEDRNPRPHPAFEADALARQVTYWLSLLRSRCVLLVAD